ncbi:MAG: ComF family protein, partial [Candidatus Latescibacterota bacterium]
MSVRGAVAEIFHALADFLYPPTCLLCGSACEGEKVICSGCFAALSETSLSFEPPRRTLDAASDIFVLLPYDRTCRTLVHAFKYHGLPSMATLAGDLMARKMLPLLAGYSRAPLVPVPLHPDKFRERGYNQCRRLADGFAAFSGHSIREDLLERTVYTGTQTALDAESRKSNVRGVFRYIGVTSLRGEPVILLDDVMTTGSTLSECARILKEAGAGNIAVCVVATPD